MLNPTWNPNTMLSFRKKYNGPMMDQETSKKTKGWTKGQKDGHTGGLKDPNS